MGTGDFQPFPCQAKFWNYPIFSEPWNKNWLFRVTRNILVKFVVLSFHPSLLNRPATRVHLLEGFEDLLDLRRLCCVPNSFRFLFFSLKSWGWVELILFFGLKGTMIGVFF